MLGRANQNKEKAPKMMEHKQQPSTTTTTSDVIDHLCFDRCRMPMDRRLLFLNKSWGESGWRGEERGDRQRIVGDVDGVVNTFRRGLVEEGLLDEVNKENVGSMTGHCSCCR